MRLFAAGQIDALATARQPVQDPSAAVTDRHSKRPDHEAGGGAIRDRPCHPEAASKQLPNEDIDEELAKRPAAQGQPRAALTLCRIWTTRTALLRTVYDTFTEGFATADLTEARGLLESARPSRSPRVAAGSRSTASTRA